MSGLRILVTGSRDVDEAARWLICSVLNATLIDAERGGWAQGVTIVHGAARGVDTVAASWVRPPLVNEGHPADWAGLGKRAGMVRNLHMVSLGADLCLAFPRRSSVGTWGCIRAAADAGIPVRIYPLPDVS